MDYSGFLKEQIQLQEKEVNSVRMFLRISLVVFIAVALFTIYSWYSLKSSATGLQYMETGFTIFTGFLPLYPRAEIIKRREKISGLRAIDVQYSSLDHLEDQEKNFVMDRLKELVIQTLNKI